MKHDNIEQENKIQNEEETVDPSALMAEISELRSKITELETSVRQNDASFMLDTMWGAIAQLRAQIGNTGNVVDLGPVAPEMEDEIGAPATNELPPAPDTPSLLAWNATNGVYWFGLGTHWKVVQSGSTDWENDYVRGH